MPPRPAKRWFAPLLFVLVVAMLMTSARIFLRQQDEMRRARRRAVELQEQYRIAERDRTLIEAKRMQKESKEEIEEMARNELGLVLPGEILFKDTQ